MRRIRCPCGLPADAPVNPLRRRIGAKCCLNSWPAATNIGPEFLFARGLLVETSTSCANFDAIGPISPQNPRISLHAAPALHAALGPARLKAKFQKLVTDTVVARRDVVVHSLVHDPVGGFVGHEQYRSHP